MVDFSDWKYYPSSKTELNLYLQALTDDDIPSLIEFLNQHPEITSLILISNKIGDAGAKLLAANTTIISLGLSANQVGDEGAMALAATTSIVYLNLYHNKIGVKGAKALASNYIIISLDLHANVIGEEGREALEEDNPIKRTNLGRSVGMAAPVPSLKRIALYQVQELDIKGQIPSKELEILPPDQIKAVYNSRP